jgi:L-iditol 2-dehydrogenase
MKALVKQRDGAGQLALLDLPQPSPAADEILIDIEYAGICGTDLHILKGHWPCKTPVVLGHEFCGTIAAIGGKITDLQVGERVVAGNPAKTCGNCLHCRAGNPFMCKNRISMGFMINGAFARFACVQRHAVHRIPEGVSMEEAALCEPLAAAVRALTERISVNAGDRILISGAGPIGLLAAAVARAQGAFVILCGIEVDRVRLACATKCGADVVVNIDRENLTEVVARHTDGKGVDISVECAGAPASLSVCFEHLRKGGTLVQVGIYSSPFQVDFSKIVMNELNVVGVYGHVWSTWERSLLLMRDKRINIRPVITHILPISRYQEGLDAIARGEAIKVLLQPKL